MRPTYLYDTPKELDCVGLHTCFLQDGPVVPTKPQEVSDTLLAKAQGTEGCCATSRRAVAPKGTE